LTGIGTGQVGRQRRRPDPDVPPVRLEPHWAIHRSNPYANRAMTAVDDAACRFRCEVPSAGVEPHTWAHLGPMPLPITLRDRGDQRVRRVRCRAAASANQDCWGGAYPKTRRSSATSASTRTVRRSDWSAKIVVRQTYPSAYVSSHTVRSQVDHTIENPFTATHPLVAFRLR
jgi:hypothetical protein